MKLITITLLCTITIAGARAQSIKANDFKTFHIKNLGIIDIPGSMELQKGRYKALAKKYYEVASDWNSNVYNAYINFENRIVFQQKGLNDYSNNAFKKYCRIIIETKIGNRGDLEKLNFSPEKITPSDIEELNSIFKRQLIHMFSNTKLKLIKFYGVNVEQVNHQTCIKVSYLRRLSNNPLVKVSVYQFQNNDRMHILTISYRLNEEDFWKPKVEKSLNSFKITNIQ